MTLAELLGAAAPMEWRTADPARLRHCEVKGLCYRSSHVQPGALFVAIRGAAADGHAHIPEALARGAVAVVAERAVTSEVPLVRVPDSRKALAALAAAFHGRPAEGLRLVGITGTNGKTTTSYLVESMLAAAGSSVGVVGTINYRFAGTAFDNPMTTPESSDLQAILATMQSAGVSHAVLEISSHAIAQERIHQLWLDVGVFTNLTRDHLDFHGEMDAYWACKRDLFTRHMAAGPKAGHAVAVINRDDAHGRELSALLGGTRQITVGREADNIVHPETIEIGLDGITSLIRTPAGALRIHSPLAGAHNLENILCALGAGLALGIAPESMARGISALDAVPGRLERVADGAGRYIYVDFAHTPDALRHALSTLKTLGGKRLLCVFGCGGDRDRGKRPIMGEIAAQLSDLTLVTSDNPRREEPEAIIAEILPGVHRHRTRVFSAHTLAAGWEGKGYAVEADRRKAIAMALSAARAGDTVLVAGKGHETYQILGDKRLPFDDRQVVRDVLAGEPFRRREVS